ncbi:MAG: hypothetical protein HY674_14895 [Chloroflexi bacterium]|nr:hypothetical protein [Chloroflexota bacterium]
MKLNSIAAGSLLLCFASCYSPRLAAQEGDSLVVQPLTIVEAGPHSRTWQSITATEVNGESLLHTNSYVELQTGMNAWSPTENKWVEASDEIELVKGGAVARKAQHQVIFSANANDPNGTIDLLLPDGKRLITQCIGIALTETDTGKSVFVAESQDSIGELVDRNVIIYPKCFDSIRGAIRVKVTIRSLENDVILWEQIPDPALYGLNPATCQLEVWHQVVSGPEPRQISRSIQRASGAVDEDSELDFDSMSIGSGRAFYLGAGENFFQNSAALERSVAVAKEYFQINNIRFLVESIPWTEAQPFLATLPAPEHAKKIDREQLKRLFANQAPDKRSKPVSLATVGLVKPAAETSVQVASIKKGRWPAEPGFIVDYTYISGGLTNYTFTGDMTYELSGPVTCSGTNTIFEGGTVLKYVRTNSTQLTVTSPIDWQGTPYRPVVLTAKEDNSVGRGGTGGPLTNYYASTALYINNGTNLAVLQNLRIAYASNAIAFSGQSGYDISHAQFVNCQNGICATNAAFSLRNALFHNVLTNFNGSSSTGRCEHVTVDTASWLNYNSACQNLYLTNSLLVAVTNVGTLTVGDMVGTNSSTSVFQAVGRGYHYLADNTYRNVGTTNINASLWADLKRMTTYPPLVLTNDFTTDTILFPQAQRDADIPDLGAHYDSLDYLLSKLNLTNATLLLTNGVAVATYDTNGITLQNGAKFISEGTPVNLNHLVRYHAVQEQPLVWGVNGPAINLIKASGSPNPVPEVSLRFTDVSMMAQRTNMREFLSTGGTRVSPVALADSRMRGVCWYLSSTDLVTCALTNTLWERGYSLSFGSASGYLMCHARNNLFRYCTLSLTVSTNASPWEWRDNFFDNSTSSQYGSGTLSNSHNAYLNSTRLIPNSTNDVVLGSFIFTNGPLGAFYHASTNLFNAGSRNATNAGLYHFTVNADQTKETNSIVDIGYHYVATDAYGLPVDSDGDGVPDYLEDRNGNGSADAGEADWQTYNSQNGLTGSPGLQVFTPLW